MSFPDFTLKSNIMIANLKNIYLKYILPFYEKHKNKNIFWFSIFFLASMVLVAPLFGKYIYEGLFSDLLFHIRFVRSAHTALFREFAFPPFYNNDLGLALEPILRYYSVTIYALSAFFMLFGFSAFNGLLLATAVFYALGAFGIFLTARFLRWDYFSSFLGGLTYLYAPYFLVDIYSREAYSEVSIVGVFPLLFYAVIRLLSSNGRKWGLRTALLTVLLLMSHKIFFPWFYCLVVLFLTFNSSIFQVRKYLFKRLFPLTFWMGIGMLLASPYWLAAYMNLPHLKIDSGVGIFFASLSEWKLLLCPYFKVSPDSTTPGLATQYGLPVLLGFILMFFSKKRLQLKFSLLAIGIVLFLLEINAGHILLRMPKPFQVIQFPYRLLVFTLLFGALSVAAASFTLSKWKYARPLKWSYFILTLLYLSLYYKIPDKTNVTSEIAEKDKMSRYFEHYLEKPSLEGRRLEGFYWDDLWVVQDAVMRLKREAGDELSITLDGRVPDEIDKSKPFFVDIFIDSKSWCRENLTRPAMKIEKLLPAVSTAAVQNIRFHFSDYFIPMKVTPNSPDWRKLVIGDHHLKVWKKRDIVVDESRMSARGNKVRVKQLEMKKEHDYILPVMYSHHLQADPDFISILAHPDGIILKTSQDGSFDVTITRREFPYIRKKLLEMIRMTLFQCGFGTG